MTAANLVQQLLRAKQTLQLECYISKLDKFDVLIIDDISYVPFERHETDVLFTLLAARYELDFGQQAPVPVKNDPIFY